MKINKIHINGFGKFNNHSISFKKGFNLVFGENEAGKSTVQSFIKAILFGFPRKNEDGEGRLPESKRFIPWDGSGFSGVMEIETDDGKNLKIERDFTRKTTSVYNENLKEVTTDYPYTKRDGLLLGENLLSMDRECFENTAFIKQGGTIVLKNDRKNLFEKLMNLSQTGNENTSAATVGNVLSKAITALGNTRTKNRPYNLAETEFNKYTSLLNNAENTRRDMVSHMERQQILDDELQFLGEKIKLQKQYSVAQNLYSEKKKLEALIKKYDGLTDEIESLSREIHKMGSTAIKSGLPAGISENDILEYIKRTATAIEKQKSIPDGDPGLKYAKLANEKNRKKVFLTLCYIGITISALLAILFHPLIFIATAILTALLIFLHIKKKPYTEEEIIRQITMQRECSEELVMVNAFIESTGREKVSSFKTAETVLNSIFESVKTSSALKSQIGVNKARMNDLEKFRKEILGKFKTITEPEALLDEIDIKIKKTGITENQMEIPPGETVLKEYESKKSELAGIKMLLRESMQSDDELAQIEESLEFYREKLKNIEEEKRALTIASGAIFKAAELMQQDIIPQINEKTGLILKHITGGSHSTLLASKDKEMNTEFENTVHSLWEFSDGTIDQMYFALRIAASEVFSEKESVPILIDEAFAYYDEGRMKSTFDFLSEISKEKQIILFTCKEKEVELVSSLGNVNVIRL